jgi:hypothetical protein
MSTGILKETNFWTVKFQREIKMADTTPLWSAFVDGFLR